MPISILIADDHQLFRQGLANLIAGHANWELVAEAANGLEAVSLAESLQPQIAVLDVEMPELDGIQAAQRIRRCSPATGIIALSMYGDPVYRRRMFEAGAGAFVLKNEAFGDLEKAVNAVCTGQVFNPLKHRGASSAPQGVGSALVDKEQLSDRERQVLRLLAEGESTRQIAEGLQISPKTVETYRSRIMLKLEIDNLPGLVKFAIRAGITEA
jgi:DNA-binding NarL/FixJ family response regulator